MIVIPAIDVMGGKAVRLRRGERDSSTVYSDEPWTLVEAFVSAGAERIHVVDLDGAFSGRAEQVETIRRIVASGDVPIQVGGGLRDRAAVDAAFDIGVDSVVLGTASVRNPAFVADACRDYPGKIIVAVDAVGESVAVQGWVETTEITPQTLSDQAAAWGAGAILYTDIHRDGMASGPNVEATAALAHRLDIPVIASGGVSSLDDLSRLHRAGIEMAIVGTAIYKGSIDLKTAINAVQ